MSSLRSSSRGAVFSSDMRVILPDSSELELADGATGLDAAAAIGPKLAEQAVLVRSNGHVQGPAPAARGRGEDPDPDHARHVRSGRTRRPAPLERAPARRGRPPPLSRASRSRSGRRSRTASTTTSSSRSRSPRRISAASRRRSAASSPRAARGSARRSPATRRARRFEQEDEPYKVELVDDAEEPISLYTQGDFTDLCRGPHLQNSKPIKALKLTGLAGAYWRGDEKNPQLTRIYGTAFYSQADLDLHLERLEEAKKRDHRRLGPQLDLFHFSQHAPAMPLWHPKGVVLWNTLEQLRSRENGSAATSRCARRSCGTRTRSGPRATSPSTKTSCSRWMSAASCSR